MIAAIARVVKVRALVPLKPVPAWARNAAAGMMDAGIPLIAVIVQVRAQNAAMIPVLLTKDQAGIVTVQANAPIIATIIWIVIDVSPRVLMRIILLPEIVSFEVGKDWARVI